MAHRFRASGSRLSLLAHVDVIMATFVDNHQVLAFPVAVIAVDVVEVYPLVANKFGSTIDLLHGAVFSASLL